VTVSNKNRSWRLYTVQSLLRKRKVYATSQTKRNYKRRASRHAASAAGTERTLATNPRNAADQTLFSYDNIAALDWSWQIGPLNRDVAEVHRNAGTHQRVGLVADVEVQMRLGRIAR
jgi:hypothetical protein